MKVQFEPGRLRLRVSRAELQALREADVLSSSLDWPGGGWCIDVVAGTDAGCEAAAGTLRITLAQASLDALDARLPSRDGVREVLALPVPIELRFEVDLHDGRRPR